MTLRETRPGRDAERTAVDFGTDLPGAWRLVVRFVWQHDRFVHHLDLVPGTWTDAEHAPDLGVRVATAAEDSGESAWPASPPLQQLDLCQLTESRRGLLGLGMAGKSHWSLAVDVAPGQLWFDLACRVQEPPGTLRSAYQLPERCIGRVVDEAGPERRLELAGLPDGLSLELRCDLRSTEMRVGADGRRLELWPNEIPERLPATVRWRYGWVATA